ncbi:metallophosphoesterase [Salinisphaera sp. S4-8]|uniref:metallophosphoesterase n=1 Tax=Salinisphaera sp. S4-8 TaxID=633357 RepID=UPI00334010A6
MLSDLHLEFYDVPERAGIRDDVDCDLLVLAGDIHVGTRGIDWAAHTFERPVLYVLGNHEFYGQDYTTLVHGAREAAASYPNVSLLENDEVTVDGVRFLGATLWSGLESPHYTKAEVAALGRSMLMDFRRIRDGDGYITPEMLSRHYHETTGWLAAKIDRAAPAVVITHFAPSAATPLLHPQFGDHPLAPYFHNNLEHLMGAGVTAWIYGHNHWSARTDITAPDGFSTSVLSNQLGYPHERAGFDPGFVLEIE